MLEKPHLQNEEIIACVQTEYGLQVAQIAFLPLGADLNTVIYRLVTVDDTPYFLKLRRGDFVETSVTFPKFLSDQGLTQIIAPLTTITDQLWATLDTFKVILYPFVAGHNGYEVDLSAQHWREFGCTLKHIHTLAVPAEIIEGISQETYSPQWRDSLKRSLAQLEQVRLVDPLAIKLATFLQVKRNEVDYLLARSEALAQVLQAQPQTFIICHADIHAGNILIDTEGVFYLVDWDTLILAPKERDLMYVGGGLMAGKRTPQQEEALFYAGYGQTEIDPIALAYYRYARIIEDIAIYCEQILQTTAGEDRVQALHYLRSNFQPNGTIEIARQADQALD